MDHLDNAELEDLVRDTLDGLRRAHAQVVAELPRVASEHV